MGHRQRRRVLGIGGRLQRRWVPGIRVRRRVTGVRIRPQRRRVPGSRGQPQLLEDARLPCSQVLEALKELAVSPNPLHCWSGSSPSICFFPGGPKLGSSVTAVTCEFPPKAPRSRQQRGIREHALFNSHFTQQIARRRLCSLSPLRSQLLVL